MKRTSSERRMLRKRLARAMRSGLITRKEAVVLWRRRNDAREPVGGAAVAATPAAIMAPVPPTTNAVPAPMPAVSADGVAPAASSGQACRPVLCRNAEGEMVWRRRGRCGQRVVEQLGVARHQVVEVSGTGDLLPPLSGEEPLW